MTLSVHPETRAQTDGHQHRNATYRNVTKRCFDLSIVLLTSPLIVAVVGILAALIAMQGGRPFYSQPRIGQNGRIYTMWKLRSMVADADEIFAGYLDGNPDARAEWNSTQKLKNDPRITKFGRFLRKSSLDELPQLFNVLIGDMSLVGPRPMLPDQRALYPGTAYYHLRPGITGLWQISERNESAFAQRADFDTEYFQRLSLRTDAEILARTFGVVLRGTGH